MYATIEHCCYKQNQQQQRGRHTNSREGAGITPSLPSTERAFFPISDRWFSHGGDYQRNVLIWGSSSCSSSTHRHTHWYCSVVYTDKKGIVPEERGSGWLDSTAHSSSKQRSGRTRQQLTNSLRTSLLAYITVTQNILTNFTSYNKSNSAQHIHNNTISK